MSIQPNELRKCLATAIRCRRLNIGLTQTDLAARLGIKQPGVSRLESLTESSPVGTDMIARVAEALEIKPSDLLDFRLEPID